MSVAEHIKLDDDKLLIAIEERLDADTSGGFAEAWKVRYRRQFNDEIGLQGVIKVLRPNSDGKKHARAVKEFEREVEFLMEIDDERVLRVYRRGLASYSSTGGAVTNTPYYLAEYYKDFIPLADVLKNHGMINIQQADNSRIQKKIDPVFISTYFLQVLKALQACHLHTDANGDARPVLHLDLHPGNIMVRPVARDGVLVCERVVLIDFGKARVLGKRGASGYTGNVQGARGFIHPDLYEFMAAYTPDVVYAQPNAVRFDYFSLSVGVLGLIDLLPYEQKRSLIAEICTKVATNFKNDGRDVIYPVDSALQALVEIKPTSTLREDVMIRLSGGDNAVLNDDFRAVIDTPGFQRLRNVYQLCLLQFIYPGAVHSRFSHSLGVFTLAGRYLHHLRNNSVSYATEITSEDERWVRLAALLHDLGHYPFAHYFEEYKSESWARGFYLDHKDVGKIMLQEEIKGVKNKAFSPKLAEVLNVRFEDHQTKISNTFEKGVLKMIIDSAIDCDKVDYLIRDGQACGIPYANNIDIDRLLESMWCIDRSINDKPRLNLCITRKGLAPVESLIAARYQMYSEVYWHKFSRMMAALVKRAMYMIIKNSLIDAHHAVSEFTIRDDWRMISWMSITLENAGFKEVARKLLHDPFLSGDRLFYKRVLTMSGAWDSDLGNASPFNLIITEAGKPDGYERLVNVSDCVAKVLNRRGYTGIVGEDVLIDVPPAEKDETLPAVFYPDASSPDKKFQLIDKVSGTLKPAALIATRKVRLFVSPAFGKALKMKEQEKPFLRDVILDALSEEASRLLKLLG